MIDVNKNKFMMDQLEVYFELEGNLNDLIRKTPKGPAKIFLIRMKTLNNQEIESRLIYFDYSVREFPQKNN